MLTLKGIWVSVYSFKFSINLKSFSKQLKKKKEKEWEKVQLQTTLLRSFAIKRSREMGQEVEGHFFKSSFELYADENNLTKGKADDEEVNLPKWRGDRRHVQAEARP